MGNDVEIRPEIHNWLGFLSTAVIAQQTVRVNGAVVTCQNSCVVTTNSDGSVDIEDSQGGWLRWENYGTAVR